MWANNTLLRQYLKYAILAHHPFKTGVVIVVVLEGNSLYFAKIFVIILKEKP